jgi:hypothetical protein
MSSLAVKIAAPLLLSRLELPVTSSNVGGRFNIKGSKNRDE